MSAGDSMTAGRRADRAIGPSHQLRSANLSLGTPTARRIRLASTSGAAIARPSHRKPSGRSATYSLYDRHVVSLLDEAVDHAEHVCAWYT